MTTGSRVLVVTLGTLGDVDPYLAVGQALVRRGHPTTIATLARHRAAVESAGLAFAECQADWTAGAPDDPMVRIGRDPDAAMTILMRDFILDRLADSVVRVRQLAGDHDVIVQAGTAYAGRMAAELLGRPWLATTLAPYRLPSRLRPPIHAWPRPLRTAPESRKLAFHRNLLAPLHGIRADLGLPPLASLAVHLSPHGNLALFSRHFADDPGDWPADLRIVGACRHVAPVGAAEWSRAQAFLAAGPAPVVVTVGTHRTGVHPDFFPGMAAAAGGLGLRVLIVGDTADGLGLEDGRHLAAFRALPFGRLFAHAAAVVCHTGIGTTTRALEAGQPILAVPFAFFDQFDNALHARRLGAAEILPMERFERGAAATLLQRLVQNPGYRAAARRYQAAAASEGDGAERAADAILEFGRTGRLG